MKIEKADDGKLLLRVPDAAGRLGLSPARLYALIASGDVPSVLLGRRSRRVVVADVDALIQAGWRPRQPRLRAPSKASLAEADRRASELLADRFMRRVERSGPSGELRAMHGTPGAAQWSFGLPDAAENTL